MATEYLDTGNDDGCAIGRDSTSKWAMHGGTPTDQYATITSPATTTASSGGWGFATSTQANAINDAVRSILDLLREKNIIASA